MFAEGLKNKIESNQKQRATLVAAAVGHFNSNKLTQALNTLQEVEALDIEIAVLYGVFEAYQRYEKEQNKDKVDTLTLVDKSV